MLAHRFLLITAFVCLSAACVSAQELHPGVSATDTIQSQPSADSNTVTDQNVPGVPPTSPQAEALRAKYRIELISVDEDGIPVTVAGDLGPEKPTDNLEEDAYDFLVKNAASYRLTDPRTELRVTRTTNRHNLYSVHFTQFYKSLPVWGSSVSVHFGRDNRISDVSTNLVTNIHVSEIPAIDSTTAKSIAARDVRIALSNAHFETVSLCIYRTFQRKIHLAWQIDLSMWTYFIDAHDGKVVDRQTRMIIN